MKSLIISFLLLSVPFSLQAAAHQKLSHYERKIVASCLILEAASDGVDGMQAVLNVIYNRADQKIGHVVKEVIKPKQFTSFNRVTTKRNPNFSPLIRRALNDPMFNDAYQLVIKLEQGKLEDNTQGADHYHTVKMPEKPYWTEAMQKTVTVGEHIFYTTRSASLDPVIASNP